MNMIALDQSITCTAYCYFEEGKLLSFGCIKTSAGTGSLHDRCYLIAKKLKRIRAGKEEISGEVTCVREGLAMGNTKGNSGKDLAMLVGYIQSDLGPMKEVSPTALKKFATGKGTASKQDMVNALPADVLKTFKEAGYKKTTGLTDLADAYFVGRYFIDQNLTDGSEF